MYTFFLLRFPHEGFMRCGPGISVSTRGDSDMHTPRSARTSKKPLMKLLGSRALGSSSVRKYLRTCESCFQ